jgi:hypothetical protein
MTKFFTILCLSLISINQLSGQSINDFETGSPNVVTRYGTSFSKVANPLKAGINTSATVGKIGRTSGNWYELIAFPANFSVPAKISRYVHVQINYPALPDVSIRITAPSENADGANGDDIRALNVTGYTDVGKWYNLTFKIDSTNADRTVKAILFLPDLGFNNPGKQVLNNTDKVAYVDQFIVSNNPILTNTKNIEEISAVSVYPNPASNYI